MNKSPKRLVRGVGINDFDRPVSILNKSIYEYRIWCEMLRRCYDKEVHKRLPRYSNCIVDTYFHSFTNFFNTIVNLKGFNNYDENGVLFELDKDLLVKGNKVYAKDTVCFIPREINAFLVQSNAIRGKNPIGVQYHTRHGKFYARLKKKKKNLHLGSFDTKEEAFAAYKVAKECYAKELAEKWKECIDERAYEALLKFSVSISD